MANPLLTESQRKTLFAPLLKKTKAELLKFADGDEQVLWALRRKLAKELSYLERDKPANRKKLKEHKRKEQNNICPLCNLQLPEKYAELDRFDAISGYTAENTRLVHKDCHIKEQQKKKYT